MAIGMTSTDCGRVGMTLATVVLVGAPSSINKAALGLVKELLLGGIKTMRYTYQFFISISS